MKKRLHPFLIVFVVFVFGSTTYAKNVDVVRIEFEVMPKSGKILSSQTAILRGKFFGKKKKGLLGGLFGSEPKESVASSSDWKIESIGSKKGFLSKPFRYQEPSENGQGGFLGFLNQGLNAVSSKDSVLFTPDGPGKYRFRLTEGRLTKEVEIEVD